MPLSQADQKAFEFIITKPKLREKLLKGLEEEGYTEHQAVQENIDFQRRMDGYLAPLKEKNEALEKELGEIKREKTWDRQRESVKKGPFHFSEEKISKLEERMKSGDAPRFPEVDSQGRTAYQNAALYFQHQDSPISNSTFPVLDFAGPSQKAESWRELMQETDKSKNPMYMSRRERRKLGDKLWNEAKEEYMANLQNR